MKRLRALLSLKVVLPILVVAAGTAIYIGSLPKTDALIGGPSVCTYYKDATYKQAVGARGTGCCGETINWGTTSKYKKCETLYCTDQLCPN